MTEQADQFDLCLTAYKTQIITALADPYFPEAPGRLAGWQVSEDDTVFFEGGDFFIVLRPGPFTQLSRGDNQENEWHVITIIYSRFIEYSNAWPQFRVFRSKVANLRNSNPLKTNGIYDQIFTASDAPGYINKEDGSASDVVGQILDCNIKQRVLQRRAF